MYCYSIDILYSVCACVIILYGIDDDDVSVMIHALLHIVTVYSHALLLPDLLRDYNDVLPADATICCW